MIWWAGLFPNQTDIIEDLKSGKLNIEDIETITFIKRTKSLAIPWSTKGYNELENKTITSSTAISDFTDILLNFTSEGFCRTSSPAATSSKNYIKLSSNNIFYYLHFHEERYSNITLIGFSTNAKNSTHPNSGHDYCSQKLVSFLKTSDPWY